jgi:hypothetical protein
MSALLRIAESSRTPLESEKCHHRKPLTITFSAHDKATQLDEQKAGAVLVIA